MVHNIEDITSIFSYITAFFQKFLLWIQAILRTILLKFKYKKSPTSGAVVLRSKLVDWRFQVPNPVALVALAVPSFPCFSPKLA